MPDSNPVGADPHEPFFGSGTVEGEGPAPDVAPTTAVGAEPLSPSDEEIAKRFHYAYERMAPHFGWETHAETQTAWSHLPTVNRALMVSVVKEAVRPLIDSLQSHLRAKQSWIEGAKTDIEGLQGQLAESERQRDEMKTELAVMDRERLTMNAIAIERVERFNASQAEVQRLRRVVDAAKRVRILHRGCQRNWLGTIHCTCGKRDLDNALAALTPTSESMGKRQFDAMRDRLSE